MTTCYPFARDAFRANPELTESDAPELVQLEFEEWLRDDHGLHADDRDKLWERFVAEVTK